MPQAVSTVATLKRTLICAENIPCFNTASGRCCCNGKDYENLYLGFDEFQYRKRQALLQHIKGLDIEGNFSKAVSIPQAVGTVATCKVTGVPFYIADEFQYRKRQALLQHTDTMTVSVTLESFNTASGRHCCNSLSALFSAVLASTGFQYRKRQALLQPLQIV